MKINTKDPRIVETEDTQLWSLSHPDCEGIANSLKIRECNSEIKYYGCFTLLRCSKEKPWIARFISFSFIWKLSHCQCFSEEINPESTESNSLRNLVDGQWQPWRMIERSTPCCQHVLVHHAVLHTVTEGWSSEAGGELVGLPCSLRLHHKGSQD